MNNKKKIGFVILHYETYTETMNCVESVMQIKDEQDIVLIIDNDSPNGSGNMLKQKYNMETNVEVIINNENMGFAKGNNVGFLLAKKKFSCDFIILLNNDTLITQNDFRQHVIQSYNQYHYAVMGPKILQKDGRTNRANPQAPIHINLRRARIGQLSNYLRYALSIIGLDNMFSTLVDQPAKIAAATDEYQENVQISGCCMIFSPEYITRFNGLNPDTFMYLEEVLLYIRIRKANLKIVYYPNLEIVHLEDAATLTSFRGKKRKARQFKYRCQMQSFRALINELKGMG